jgi:hypothetical protein
MTDPQQQVPPWWTDPTKNVESLVEAAMKRQDDLRGMESMHVRGLMSVRAAYEDRRRAQESARIDAIRQVDVGAVQRAAEVATTQAQALATQLLATAEASRVQVQAAATAAVTSLAAALEPIQKDIRDLRDAQSRGVGGKEQVVETRGDRNETRLNMGTLVAVGLLVVAVLTFIALYAAKK